MEPESEVIDLDASRESAGKRPFKVLLGGEEFMFVATVPAAPYLRLFTTGGLVGGSGEIAVPLVDLIHATLIDDENISRFDALCERKIDPIDSEDLFVLVNRLLERYTNRPPVPPTGSPDGRLNGSNGSTVDSS